MPFSNLKSVLEPQEGQAGQAHADRLEGGSGSAKPPRQAAPLALLVCVLLALGAAYGASGGWIKGADLVKPAAPLVSRG